jgi:hypothetical protein
MEEITYDFSDLIGKFDVRKIEYYALYDSNTLTVTGIYPSHALEDKSEAIQIDRELADSINEGRLNMSKCKANLYTRTVEVIEDVSEISIDTVLHRIIEKKWNTKKVKNDILITYDSKASIMRFNIHPKYFSDVTWPTSLELKFIVTGYNDPHVLYETVSFTLGHILDKKKIELKINIDDTFSIFTKRVFPHYQLEII